MEFTSERAEFTLSLGKTTFYSPNSPPANSTAYQSIMGPVFETANVNDDVVVNRDHLLLAEIAFGQSV